MIVDCWLIPSALPGAVLSDLAAVLDDDENRRARALPEGARRTFVAAHGAARRITGELLGIAPRSVPWRHRENGCPDVPGVTVSLSRSGEYAMLACAPAGTLGVDLQEFPRVDAARAARRFYPPDEADWVAASDHRQRYTGLLARKEACVKASGGRLFAWLPRPVRDELVSTSDGVFRVRDVPAPAGYAAAVAVAGAESFRVRARRWRPGGEVE